MILLKLEKQMNGKIGSIDDHLDQELIMSQKQEFDDKKELLYKAMKILNDREKEIIRSKKIGGKSKKP